MNDWRKENTIGVDENEVRRWLVVYDSKTGFAELSNVGVYDAKTSKEARDMARKDWHTTASLSAYEVNYINNGWSYYQ